MVYLGIYVSIRLQSRKFGDGGPIFLGLGTASAANSLSPHYRGPNFGARPRLSAALGPCSWGCKGFKGTDWCLSRWAHCHQEGVSIGVPRLGTSKVQPPIRPIGATSRELPLVPLLLHHCPALLSSLPFAPAAPIRIPPYPRLQHHLRLFIALKSLRGSQSRTTVPHNIPGSICLAEPQHLAPVALTTTTS